MSAAKAAMPVATPEMHKNAEKLLASARAQATGQRPASPGDALAQQRFGEKLRSDFGESSADSEV